MTPPDAAVAISPRDFLHRIKLDKTQTEHNRSASRRFSSASSANVHMHRLTSAEGSSEARARFRSGDAIAATRWV